VDLSLEAAIALVSQATHLSSSGRTSAHLNSSSSKGSTLSTSSRITRTISQEEVSSRGRISRHLVSPPQQPTRAVRQHQFRVETEHVSIVESKAIGRCMSEEGSPGAVRPSAPAKQNVSQPGAGNRSQPCYNHGRLNHLEAEAVQKTPGMIVGMFLVDSHISEVLFDTGATHSFITESWVEAHNLPITTMSTPIQIDLAGGRIRVDSICLNVSVEIRGIEFSANLIVMGTQGIDVTLGMNWLDKYQAIISCDKRIIKLMSPLGGEVVAELISPEPRKGSCYQITIDSSEADPLEIIKVVFEFPDVFPKDLSGMPPE
jgi:hypothetical protein